MKKHVKDNVSTEEKTNFFIETESKRNRDGNVSPLDERQLIKSVLNGNTAHAKLLFEDNKKKVLNLILSRIHDKQVAENLTQETFIKVFRNLAGFRHQCSLRSWIFSIAINLCKDYAASQKNRHWNRRVTIDDHEHTTVLDSLSRQKSSSPQREVLELEKKRRLYDAIDKLPPKQKECILLSLEGYSYDEISSMTDTPGKTVGTRIFNARKKLRALLANYFEEK